MAQGLTAEFDVDQCRYPLGLLPSPSRSFKTASVLGRLQGHLASSWPRRGSNFDNEEFVWAGTATQRTEKESLMPEHSSMQAYLNWTKERLDEMDATLASLEAKASQLKADAKAKADHLIADLKERRDEFQAKAKAQAQAGEATLQTSKTQLESQWPASSAAQDLLRDCRQTGPAATSHVPGHCDRSKEGLARSDEQVYNAATKSQRRGVATSMRRSSR